MNEQVADVQRTVLNQIVHARETAAHACPIPIAVYAGETDNVVTPASARSAFPDAVALPGDHFTIVRPDSLRHRSYTALKRQLLAAGDSGPPVEAVVTVGADRLEVHTAIDPCGTAAGASSAVLMPYLPRGHDTALRGALEPVLGGGPSVLAVLTGESPTGKTRALYEALLDLAPDRLLLRPAGAEDLLALLEGGRVVPGVVVWLNEAQRFLHGSVGERAVARLRDVLERQPGVVAVGALWTAPYWNDLTRGSARAGPRPAHRPVCPAHPGRGQAVRGRARAVGGARPPSEGPAADPGMEGGAGDGKVVQHLSGGPELLAAYLVGPGAHFTRVEHTLLTAALDARRLGHHGSLSAALLVEAADGALHPRHHSPDPAWAEPVLQALATGERSDGTRADIRRTLTALTALRRP
ncbi:hypothetical protein ACWG5P_31870 [Streptomyces prasinus]